MSNGSVTNWIGQVKAGGEGVAERELWDRYFTRLAALARQQLRDLPPHLRDEEDLALSALNSFFARAQQDGFPLLRDRTDLWQLLAKITVRKAIQRRRYLRAKKRDVGPAIETFVTQLQNLAAEEPTPAMLVAVKEEFERLLGGLDADLRTVAHMKLAGYTNCEIAKSMGRVERTVERKLERIRDMWLKEVQAAC